MNYLAGVLWLLSVVVGVGHAAQVSVADGDVESLISAITSTGTATSQLEVLLAPNGTYTFDGDGPVMEVRQSVIVNGRGARLTVKGLRRNELIRTGCFPIHLFTVSVEHIRSDADALFLSSGMSCGGGIRFIGATFSDIEFVARDDASHIVLVDTGKSSDGFRGSHLTFSNLAFGGAETVPKAVFIIQANSSSGLDLSHITVTGVRGDANAAIFWTDGTFPKTHIDQSLIGNNQVETCHGPVLSRGENVFDDNNCGFMSLGDRLVDDVGLLPLDSTLVRIPVHPLKPDSPAIDAGSYCNLVFRSSLTYPRDGNGDGIVRCDAGAFEMALPSDVPGMTNGLFFSSRSDGHYVSIQQTDDSTFLIYWYTFDLAGNEAWILAIGQLQDKTIVANAYTSSGGALVPGAAPVGQTVKPWGQLRIRLKSCRDILFEYASSQSEFGSGRFWLQRLASLDAIGCED